MDVKTLNVCIYLRIALNRFLFTTLALLVPIVRLTGGQLQISQDRELKELDLTKWDCLNRPEGSAKTLDGVERNRQKNRPAPTAPILSSESLDMPSFLKRLAEFDAQTKGKKRTELNPAERQQLDLLEKQVVHFTGYLVAAYCGPPETTNCKSVDFHDWHLELFDKPQDHPPQPGDATPVVCEITPRTQNGIYHSGIRIQELTAFFRPPDPHLPCESTGHAAEKIRITGYLLWDDEHNGSADVGTTIRKIAANGYHQPWRSTAWEIHPVFKIEPVNKAPARAEAQPASPPPTASSAAENLSPTPAQSAPAAGSEIEPRSTPPPPSTPVAKSPPEEISTTPAPTPPQFVTLTQPVKIKIPYGETVLPRGAKLPVVSHGPVNVTVQYMGGTYVIPAASTDLR